MKAVIFDLDGVIADTEPIQAQARNDLLRSFGLSAEGTNSAAIGRGKREWWGIIAKEHGLPYSGAEIAVMDFSRCLRYIRETHLAPTAGLRELLEYLRRSGVRTAVASSSDRFYVEDVLKYMELDGYFCGSACGDEVPASKPAAYLYQKALELCGVSAAESFAIEDSDTGALAARAAGIPCIAYDAAEGAAKQSFGTCVFKAKSMQEILSYMKKEQEK